MTEARHVGCLRFVTRLIFLASCVSGFYSERARATEQDAAEARKVIARVNGQPIYEDQLKPELDKSLRSLRRYGIQKNDDLLAKRLQLRLLNKAIGNLLVNQESKKRTVENMEEKVEQRVKDLEKKYEMERYLKIRRITIDDLRESLKTRVRLDEYLKEQGVLEPEIPEDRIREMYDGDPKSFSKKETVRVSHVLIAMDKDAGQKEKDQARKKTEQIRKEILEGKDFAAVAKEHSNCKSAPGGGDLGHIKKGFMPAEFDTVAFELEKDAVSEVVESEYGFHIIKLVDKSPGGVVPYEQMRDFLKKYLQGEESKKKLESHVVELRKKSEIEILLN